MDYIVYVRSTNGTLLEKYPCTTPMEGLSWLAARFRAQQGFETVHIASCRQMSDPFTTQWVLEIR